MADLVAMLNERNFNVQVALGQSFHNAAYRPEGTNQAAAKRERNQSCNEQPRRPTATTRIARSKTTASISSV
jgi:hypothetical protein